MITKVCNILILLTSLSILSACDNGSDGITQESNGPEKNFTYVPSGTPIYYSALNAEVTDKKSNIKIIAVNESATFDNGFIPGENGFLKITGLSSLANIETAGSIVVKLERTALSDIDSRFSTNSGITSLPVMLLLSTNQPQQRFQFFKHTSEKIGAKIAGVGNDITSVDRSAPGINAPEYSELMLTWDQNGIDLLIDGVKYGTTNNYPTALRNDLFDSLFLGGTSLSGGIGNYRFTDLIIFDKKYNYQSTEPEPEYRYAPDADPIFTSLLTSSIEFERKGGTIKGTGGEFSNEGFYPGPNGFLDLSKTYKVNDISNEGTVILKVQTTGIAITELDTEQSQSQGIPRSKLATLIRFFALGSVDQERIQFYILDSNNVAAWVDDGTVRFSEGNQGVNTIGMPEYVEVAISWDVTSIDFWIDGLLYYSIKATDVTLPINSQVFSQLLIGGTAQGGYDQAIIKDFSIYNKKFRLSSRKKIVIFGGSFYKGAYSNVIGILRYSASWGQGLVRSLRADGVDLDITPITCNGHGWSTIMLDFLQFDNPENCDLTGRWLGNYVESISYEQPDLIITGMSVNDRNQGVTPEDLEATTTYLVNKMCIENPDAKIIFMGLFPWNKANGFNTEGYRQFTLDANEIARNLNPSECGSNLIKLDLFDSLGGFDYDESLTIGSSLTITTEDFHPSAKGHVEWLNMLLPVVREALIIEKPTP